MCVERKDTLTIIEISARIESLLSDEDSPYYSRVEISPLISSTTKFNRVTYRHLGFHAWSAGPSRILRKGERYTYRGLLGPNVDTEVVIPPFKLTLENVGDSFMGVHIRMRDSIPCCKMTLLQEQSQPKAPKVIDDFIEYEGAWYCTTVMNCLQTVRIEEVKGDL